ncbi:hypothetical protein P838_04375 [Enterobacter hormaechei]|uniref:tail fiber/spike domain-containing protein n=1 Tax=Enterobacter hormaechei TaxID=158836 RepID=UPI00044FAAB2|nr:GDSL-type esterase/lipase family protein [Enterobacter hormaechei]EUL63040.1 hypothetical protein P838_04375 [Enterobacter hormaechei]EUL63622.1 hypothetical protein P839_04035 [Enterobacter hormaechei]
MATTPTQNSVPSESPLDLKFNAGKIDEFVTSLVNTYVDRFGNEHYTIEGLRWLAQQAISQYGWIPVGTFQAGATLTLPNQILKDTTDGEYYRWDGSFQPSGKVVPNGSTPGATGGVGVGAWISVGDSALRSLLSSTSGAANVGTSSGNTVQSEIDALDSAAEFAETSNQILPSFSEFGGQMAALKSDLSNPFTQFCGIVLVGDSITWGLSADGISTTEPRGHALTDPRNNSTSATWANLFHKYIGKRFHFNPTYTESNWPGSPSGVCIFKYVDVVNSYPGYTPVTMVGSWTDNSRGGSLLNRTIDTSTVGDSFYFNFTGNEFDIVFSSNESTGTLIVSCDGVDIATINTNSSATGSVSFKVRRTITLSSFKRNSLISVRLSGGGAARIEAISVNKTTRVTNQGLIGVTAEEYNTIFSNALSSGDMYCLIMLGTNDRGGTNNARAPNALQVNTTGFASFLRGRDINPIICSANQITGPQINGSFFYQMQSVSAALREASRKNVCDFIDHLPVTTLARERFQYTVSDGLHPNNKGHYLMYLNLLNALENSGLNIGERATSVSKTVTAPTGNSNASMLIPLLSSKSGFSSIEFRLNGGAWYLAGTTAVAPSATITATVARAFISTSTDNILVAIANSGSSAVSVKIDVRAIEQVYCS